MPLPTDESPATLARYAALGEALLAQFPGRISQLDCGPTLGVTAFWLTPPSQAEQAAFDATVAGWDWGTRVGRTLLAIRADLAALSTAKKNAVWADFTSGTPPKWSTDAGPNAAALGVIQLLGASATLSAADVLEAKLRGVAMYCQDNPTYLVHPSFDATINVPGDELLP